MLTRTLACDLARYSLRVNAVAPGFIEAPMASRLSDRADISEEAFRRRTPLGRLGQVDEVARVVAFLASGWASYVT